MSAITTKHPCCFQVTRLPLLVLLLGGAPHTLQAQPLSALSTPTLQLVNIQLHSSLAITQFTITNPAMRVTASGVDATNAALYACGVAAATVSDSTFTFTGFTPASTYTESTSMLNLCAATVVAQRVDFTANSFYRPAAAYGCFHLEAQTSGTVEDCTFTHCGTAVRCPLHRPVLATACSMTH